MPAIMTHGIPMRIWNNREDREETAYLSTRRSGDIGKDLTLLRRNYHEVEATIRQIGRDLQLITVAVRDDMPVEHLREAAEQQDALIDNLRVAETSLSEIAEELVRKALAACHGQDEAERLMDCLSDRQLHQAVRVMDLGEEPSDFFDGRDTRSNAHGTGPVADTSGGSLSKPATAQAT